MPTSSDDVIISTGTTVTVDANQSARIVTVQSNGTLTIGSGATLTADGDMTMNGPVTGQGTLRVNGSSVNNNANVSVASVQFGGAAQSLGGVHSYSNNTVTILNGSSTTLTGTKQMSSIMIDPGGHFDFSNRALFLSGPAAPFISAGTYTATNSTVEYNGSTAQSLSPTVPSYFNININNFAGASGFDGLISTGLLRTIAGTFTCGNATLAGVQIGSGTSLIGISGTTMAVSANFVNNGVFTPNSNTVHFNGADFQTIAGLTTTITFANLATSGGSIVNLGRNVIVTQQLTLGKDIQATLATLTMPSTGTSTGVADVVGNVRRTGFTAGGPGLSFGNPFNTIAFAPGGSVPSEITVNLSKTAPPDFPEAVQRSYSITPSGGGTAAATLRLHYVDSELNGNRESGLKLFRLGNGWIREGATSIDTTNNWVEKAGVSQFSTWTLGSVSTTSFDFDGDGKTDVGIFRPSVAEWWINQSSTGITTAGQFGASTDVITPSDITGDGKTDIAFFRPSTGFWFVLRSEDFSYFSFPFGANGDVPVPADYDGDGKADATVFRPSTSTWFIQRSSDGGATIGQFGAAGDVPVPADYDGDGKADIAIYRPSLGQWWVQRSTAGVMVLTFGNATDKPVQGDYTGDGKADIAFFRPTTGEWFISRSEDFSYYSQPFGTTGDVPAPGDYDGDGRFDLTVFRPSQATWYSQRSTAGTLIQQFGASGDRPIPNAFVP